MGSIFRLEKRQAFPEPIVPPFPGAPMSGSGGAPKVSDALAVPAAYAAIALLSQTVASLSLRTYRQGADNGPPVRLPDPPIITAPSGDLTSSAWLAQGMVSLLTDGNIYGRVVARDRNTQRPDEIRILGPDSLLVMVDDDTGRLSYKSRKTQQVIPPEDIWHVAGMTLPGEPIGLSPITYAAAVLRIDISSRRFASDFFDGGGIPKAVLTTEQTVDETKAKTIKDRFMSNVRGREPMLIGNGVKYNQISVRPEESQFLKTQDANIAQVARYFGVPPEMIGGSASGGGSVTYASVEQRAMDFLTYSLSPWLKRLEQAISALLPRGVYVEFHTAELLRTDAETTARIDIQYLAGKVFAPSEIRERMGRPPMTKAQKEEADLVPMTITPMGNAKALKPLSAPAAEPTPADSPKSDGK